MLAPGARIAVVAPAGAVAGPSGEGADRLDAGIEVLRSWGYEPVPGPHLRGRHRDYFAGTVPERAADLRWALTDPTIDAVAFARGGFGTAQLLPFLPWDRLDERAVIGFSDATALLVALGARTGSRRPRGVHGPVVSSLGGLPGGRELEAASVAALRDLLAGGGPGKLSGRLLAGPDGAVSGQVVGGNLTVLASLAGTPWALRAAGAIVVLEDVGEAPYRIERAVGQLVDSGALRGAVGVAIGEMDGCGDPATVEAALLARLGSLGVPIVGGLPVGHGTRNRAFPIGARGRLGPDGLVFETRLHGIGSNEGHQP